ncbi:hypothetical protein IQ17_04083 [Bradyrhizobium daqingense]|uniref:Uncharacterized protein n=1 Tax=Bradyrhizobium daqingense TaxID=993502 RepID=A0A562L486_9BRAD|nr:hypothetical protein IQ17_04083 [Bradyrhizobium daqingense]
MSKPPSRPSRLGKNPSRITVRLRADQAKAIARLSGPPPRNAGESEVVRRLIDAGLKATQR